MSEDNAQENTPTLEMRLAAIEDKLARLTVTAEERTVTAEEMAAYNKVAGLVAARGASAAGTAASPRLPTISPIGNCWVHVYNCWIFNCSITPIHPIVVNDCIQFTAGAASSGGGFGRLGGD
jgi:hypothetical protein